LKTISNTTDIKIDEVPSISKRFNKNPMTEESPITMKKKEKPYY
jgi:hypothetical protein